MGGMTQPARGDLRASDADRTLVEEVLNNAYVDGRLTRDELDERLGNLWKARTFNELTPLTEDLIPVGHQLAPVTQYSTPTSDAPVARIDTHNTTRATDTITAILGDHKRTAEWRMRENTNATTVMGTIKLDLTQAVLESPQPRVHVNCVMGDVILRVPAGVSISNHVSSLLADVSLKGLRPGPNPITITLTGFSLMGDVKVIGPDHVSFADRLFGRA